MGRLNDAFNTLGLENDATDREIKLTYLKLAKKIHPDINKHDPRANEKFLDIQNAYETIMDQKTKKSPYTKERKSRKPPRPTGFGRNNFKFESIFDSFFNESRTSRNPTHLDRPQTHVDLRKRTGRKRTPQSEDIFSSFDHEFYKLVKRFFNDF
ncbi:MAG: hypothetical protein EU541_08515 [Promethearchaeota archaeon]|nr:MAG: hypothetical protein EU541_08515 [Candidatus Lokiarchaeota archaeon]